MKKLFLLAFLALGLMTSCQKEDLIGDSIQSNPSLEVVAVLDEALETRTQLSEKDANGYKTLWAEDDILSVFNAGNHYKYVIIDGAGELVANFKYDPFFGDVTGGIEDEANSDVFVSVYPFDSKTTVAKSGDDYVVNTVIPTDQKHVTGSFGQDAAPMVAVNKTTPNFSFKNIASVLVMPLKGEGTIVSATLESKTHKIAGKAVVTAVATNKYIPTVNVENGESKITLSCGKGVALDATTPTNFHFVLAPGTYEANDLVITFYDSEGNCFVTEISAANEFKRSGTRTFGVRTFEVTGPEKSELWIEAKAGAYMDAERLIPSFMATKSIIDDAKALASWVKNLKDKPNTKELIEEAITYIELKNYKAAYRVLGGIPGLELQTLRFKAVGEYKEKVDFTGVSYLKSFVNEIDKIKTAEDFIAFLNEFEKVYQATGIQNMLNELVGNFANNVKGYLDHFSYNQKLANTLKAMLDLCFDKLENLSIIELMEKAASDPYSLEGKFLNSLFANDKIMGGIKTTLKSVVEKIEAASKESIDISNKKAAIEVAKTNAILNARVKAGEMIMTDFNSVNAENLANLNKGPWGVLKSLLNKEGCEELFTKCGISDVYTAFTKLINKVEDMVLYDKGTIYYDIENMGDYQENVDWWLLNE